MMVQRLLVIAFAAFLCLFAPQVWAEPLLSALSREMPTRGKMSNMATYQVDFRVVITAPVNTLLN